jgi:hypothetical protein
MQMKLCIVAVVTWLEGVLCGVVVVYVAMRGGQGALDCVS